LDQWGAKFGSPAIFVSRLANPKVIGIPRRLNLLEFVAGSAQTIASAKRTPAS
jgi:hypothetical protein